MTNFLRFRNQLVIKSLPLVIFLLYLLLALLPDLRNFVPELVAVSAVIIILISLALFLSQRIQIEWSAGFILLIAATVRFLFLFRAPELSDDIYRYLFDGLMFLDGHNPYAAPPAEMLTDNRAMALLISRINHAELFTIYPPAAQFVFAVGAFIGNVTGMKLCLVMVDLSSCVVIIGILDKIRLPRANAILYAWHPLPVIEVAASGHVDAAAIFFLLVTLLILLSNEAPSQPTVYRSKRKPWGIFVSNWAWLPGCAAGIFLSLAVLTKWIPLIFLPGILLITGSGSRKHMVFGFLISSTAMFVLFWPEVRTSFHTLFIYAANWEFSGFLFRWLRVATGSGVAARLVIVVVFVTALVIIYVRHCKTDHSSSLFRMQEISKCFYLSAMAFLFLTPTLHPWYVLYMVAFLPFAAGPAGIVFSWSIFLAYRVVILYGLTGQWMEDDLVPLLVVIAPASALAIGTIIGPALSDCRACRRYKKI